MRNNILSNQTFCILMKPNDFSLSNHQTPHKMIVSQKTMGETHSFSEKKWVKTIKHPRKKCFFSMVFPDVSLIFGSSQQLLLALGAQAWQHHLSPVSLHFGATEAT